MLARSNLPRTSIKKGLGQWPSPFRMIPLVEERRFLPAPPNPNKIKGLKSLLGAVCTDGGVPVKFLNPVANLADKQPSPGCIQGERKYPVRPLKELQKHACSVTLRYILLKLTDRKGHAAV